MNEEVLVDPVMKLYQCISTVFQDCLEGILRAGASFNMYMFHGGTNFGFMAGANYFEGSHYKPDVTSYGKVHYFENVDIKMKR